MSFTKASSLKVFLSSLALLLIGFIVLGWPSVSLPSPEISLETSEHYCPHRISTFQDSPLILPTKLPGIDTEPRAVYFTSDPILTTSFYILVWDIDGPYHQNETLAVIEIFERDILILCDSDTAETSACSFSAKRTYTSDTAVEYWEEITLWLTPDDRRALTSCFTTILPYKWFAENVCTRPDASSMEELLIDTFPKGIVEPHLLKEGPFELPPSRLYLCTRVSSAFPHGFLWDTQRKFDVNSTQTTATALNSLFSGTLLRDEMYLWLLDRSGNFVIAPEHTQRHTFPTTRPDIVKHGDLSIGYSYTEAERRLDKSFRGGGFFAGELNYNQTMDKWVMDNQSSMMFFKGFTEEGENYWPDERGGSLEQVLEILRLLRDNGVGIDEVVFRLDAELVWAPDNLFIVPKVPGYISL